MYQDSKVEITFCAFVNSPDPPVREIIKGWYVKEKEGEGGRGGIGGSLQLSKFVERWYPHPEASKDAFLVVLSEEVVGEYSRYRFSKDYPKVFLFWQAQRNLMEGEVT